MLEKQLPPTPEAPSPLLSPPLPLQTELHTRLRENERKAAFLIANSKYVEVATLLESMQYQLKDYYRVTPALSKNMQVIRSLNKLRKREELSLLHNQALVCHLSNNPERAIDLLAIIVEEITDMIQAEQTRCGFLQQAEQLQRGLALDSIATWKHALVRYYYFLALVTYQSAALEISLAALMKGLDLIKESYRTDLQAASKSIDAREGLGSTYAEQLCHFDAVQELYLLCELRERVCYSKYLNIASMNTLVEMAIALLEPAKPAKPNSPEFEEFEFSKMAELELPRLDKVGSNEQPTSKCPSRQVKFNKVAQFLYYHLMGRIYSEQNRGTESEYQKLKNTKNIILIHLLEGILSYHHLPLCPKVDDSLQEYRQLYKSKTTHPRQPINVYALIDLFGLTPDKLTKNPPSFEDLSIIQQQNRLPHKQKKQIIKKPKQGSKSKSKSKPERNLVKASKSKERMGKTGKVEQQKVLEKDKEKKLRVKEEYMLKKSRRKAAKPCEDHLLKAINQNYRSFDSSLSKDKHGSPFRRGIRTETCITEQRKKESKAKAELRTKRH